MQVVDAESGARGTCIRAANALSQIVSALYGRREAGRIPGRDARPLAGVDPSRAFTLGDTAETAWEVRSTHRARQESKTTGEPLNRGMSSVKSSVPTPDVLRQSPTGDGPPD